MLGTDFNKHLQEWFDDDNLWEFWGGKFKYKHSNTNYLKLLSGFEEPEGEVEGNTDD